MKYIKAPMLSMNFSENKVGMKKRISSYRIMYGRLNKYIKSFEPLGLKLFIVNTIRFWGTHAQSLIVFTGRFLIMEIKQ